MMTWEERMAAKHRHPGQSTEIPWREPTLQERIWQPNIGRWWAPWFRWRLPRLMCRTCYDWRRHSPTQIGFVRVCDRKTCKHRHHNLEVWFARI